MTPRPTIGMTLCSGIGAPEMAAPWVRWIMDRMRKSMGEQG